MATAKKTTYSSSWTENNIKSFFDSLDCPLITTELISSASLTVHVNNIVDLKFDNGYSQVTYNGTTTSYSVLNNNTSCTITAVYSSNLFYVQLCCNYDAGRRIAFLYEIIGNNNYFGAVGSGTGSTSVHAWYSINAIPLTCVEDNVPYAHGNLLNYSTSLGYIDYCADILLQSFTATNIIDSNFMSCTEVPTDQVITFNSQNYYTIGAHTLVPIDPIT